MDETTTTGAVAVREIVTPLPDSQQDPDLYKIIIYFLGAAVMLMMVGGIVLAGMGKEVPAALIAIAAGAAGALGGALVGPTVKAG
jgi:fatty acid desaturase